MSVKEEGLGLGLQIVRGIAESHGARLHFVVRPAAHVCLCGESPLIARSGEDLAIRQSQGGNELMKEADSKASARRTGI